MLFRRDSFRDVGGLDEQLGWAFDLHLNLKVTLTCAATCRGHCVRVVSHHRFKWSSDGDLDGMHSPES